MLGIVQDLFEGFHQSDISYCHWKSNEHLAVGLKGKTDLDILINRKDFSKVNQLLLELNYKRCKTVSYLDYFSIEDFIGFDERTGKLVHIHLHYELVVGRKFLKGYHLPLESRILAGRVFDDSYNVYTISPDWEILLLLLRRALKYNFFNGFKFWKGVLPEGEKREYRWLLERIDLDRVTDLARELIDESFSSSVKACIKSGFSKKSFFQLKDMVIDRYKKHSLYSKTGRFIYYMTRKFLAALKYLKARHLHRPVPYRRGLKAGGVVIVFLGVDGAGKSTLIGEINKWLSWKLDIYQIYFGSGDGRSSLLRLPLRLIARVRSRVKGNVVKQEKKEYNEKRKSFIYRSMKAVWALTLALEKRKKLQKMWKARTRGMIVLCDRYPQTLYAGFNDGPLIRDWSTSDNKLKKALSAWEYNVYNLANELLPDLVLKLMIPVEIAVERKKDTPLYKIKEKIEVVNSLEYKPPTEVYRIDTSKDKEETVLEIKKIIWSAIDG